LNAQLKYIFITIFFITFSNLTFSQSQNDSLFAEARKLGYAGKNIEARNICKILLNNDSTNSDYSLLLARLYAWDKNYDSTRLILNNLIDKNKSNFEALELAFTIEIWDNNYEKASKLCSNALQFYPSNENFLLQKAKILFNLKDYISSLDFVELILILYPDNQEAKDLLRKLKIETAKNEISLNYSFNIFQINLLNSWQSSYLQYKRNTKYGSLIGRVNWANRFQKNGFQYEIDAYPKILKNGYLYLNYGFSNSSIFPKLRIGGEYFHSFQKGFEASLGFRYLEFDSSNVLIYTASVSKYFGNYWLSGRVFLTPKTNGISNSYNLALRKYYETKYDFVGLSVSYGMSPDDKQIIVSDKNLNLKSFKIGTTYSKQFQDFWFYEIQLNFATEEYFNKQFRNSIILQLTFSRIF